MISFTSFIQLSIFLPLLLLQDGSKIATAGQEKIVKIFDISESNSELSNLSGHTDFIKEVVWDSEHTLYR